MKRLILFTTLIEAGPLVDALGAKPIPGSNRPVWPHNDCPHLFEFDGGLIALTDLGVHRAHSLTLLHGQSVDEIWNFGIAGALAPLSIGSLVSIQSISLYNPAPDFLDPMSLQMMQRATPKLQCQGSHSLLTSPFPLHDTALKKKLAKEWDLVDMEGYGMATAANFLNKPIYLWKAISDFAENGGRELLRKHIQALSEELAEKALQEMGSTAKDYPYCSLDF